MSENQEKKKTKALKYEQIVLGSCMISTDYAENAVNLLIPDDFYYTKHRTIFEVIAHLVLHNRPPDIFMISEKLDNELPDIGGAGYLNELTECSIDLQETSYYIERIRKEAVVRSTENSARKLLSGDIQSKEFIQILYRNEERFRNNILIVKIGDNVENVLDILEKTGRGNVEMSGISTGYRDIDSCLGGFEKGDYIILAGRPSMGKTVLGLEMSVRIAEQYKVPVLIYSLETTTDKITARMLYSKSKVSSGTIKYRTANEFTYEKLIEGAEKLKGLPIYIIDNPDLTALDIRLKSRQFKRKYPNLGLIMIDYLTLINPDIQSNELKETSETSKSMKRMAKELDIPLLMLAQLSRKCEERPNKRPKLSDLRSSGQIEQDADIVMMNFYEYKYKSKREELKNVIETEIVKNKEGPLSRIVFDFFPDQRRIEDKFIEKLEV